mgnify:CR=1 FL=1
MLPNLLAEQFRFAGVKNGTLINAITETITVTGSSPVVDIRNVAQTQVMTRDMLDAAPTARVIGSSR